MWVRCITSPRASRLGSKSSSDAASSTLARVASATGWRLPERTREAVVIETPARAATSARDVRRLERPDIGIQVKYPVPAQMPHVFRQSLAHSDASETHRSGGPASHRIEAGMGGSG